MHKDQTCVSQPVFKDYCYLISSDRKLSAHRGFTLSTLITNGNVFSFPIFSSQGEIHFNTNWSIDLYWYSTAILNIAWYWKNYHLNSMCLIRRNLWDRCVCVQLTKFRHHMSDILSVFWNCQCLTWQKISYHGNLGYLFSTFCHTVKMSFVFCSQNTMSLNVLFFRKTLFFRTPVSERTGVNPLKPIPLQNLSLICTALKEINFFP